MLLLNYRLKIWTKITQDIKSRAGWTEKKRKTMSIATADKKNLSGQFFVHTNFLSKIVVCPDNFLFKIFFCLDNFLSEMFFFVRNFFLSRPFFGPDNFFVWTIFLIRQFFCPDNFFSGQKGIYHKVEFCHIFIYIYIILHRFY